MKIMKGTVKTTEYEDGTGTLYFYYDVTAVQTEYETFLYFKEYNALNLSVKTISEPTAAVIEQAMTSVVALGPVTDVSWSTALHEVNSHVIENGEDLDNYVYPGVFCSKKALSSSYTLYNIPSCIGTATFSLEVIPMGTTGQMLQRVTRCYKTDIAIAERVFYTGTWGDWIIQHKTNKQSITTFATGWSQYSSTHPVNLRKFGNVVQFCGGFKNDSVITLNTDQSKVCTIPSGFRPPQDIYELCQGSGQNKYLLKVFTDGTVKVSRYGIDSYVSIPVGSWFPFNVTWILD